MKLFSAILDPERNINLVWHPHKKETGVNNYFQMLNYQPSVIDTRYKKLFLRVLNKWIGFESK